MSSPPSRAVAERTRPVAWGVGAIVVATGLWWGVRAAEGRRLAADLSTWSDAALPEKDTPVDGELAELGSRVFERSCSACHAITGPSRVGPDLAGVTARRELAWIRSMVLSPDSMTRADPLARALKESYGGVQMMVPGGIDAPAVRAVLEFLRRVDAPLYSTPAPTGSRP